MKSSLISFSKLSMASIVSGQLYTLTIILASPIISASTSNTTSTSILPSLIHAFVHVGCCNILTITSVCPDVSSHTTSLTLITPS